MRASHPTAAGDGIREDLMAQRSKPRTAPRCVAVSGTARGYINLFIAKRVIGQPPSAGGLPKARRRGSQTGDIIYNFILSFSQYFCLTLKTHLPLIREMSFQSFYISEGSNFVILLYLKFLLSVVVEKIIFFSFTLSLT